MSAFQARNLGNASYFLGMDIVRDRTNGTPVLGQRKYMSDVLSRFGMEDANGKLLPACVNTVLKVDGEPLDVSHFDYAGAVGCLQYLAACTRPDIAYVVNALARYVSQPTVEQDQVAEGLLRYVASTRNVGLEYGATCPLLGYCDADFASNIDNRRSTTGYVFLLNGAAVSWRSRLQPTVAASTCEAEYMAAPGASKEALWLRMLLHDFGQPLACGYMCADNQGALKVLKHPISSSRTKHIDVVHHSVRERISRDEISFNLCGTKEMVADILTKALPKPGHQSCFSSMGLRSYECA
jgi:hypothetical protein